jgi:toxin ParE1/3/4
MSAPKLPIELTAPARRDLRAILLYTLRQWGAAQQQRYATALDQALAAIGDNPEIGRARDDLRPGYRACLVDQHLIIYRITHNAVIVLRVLHARADARRALRGR